MQKDNQIYISNSMHKKNTAYIKLYISQIYLYHQKETNPHAKKPIYIKYITYIIRKKQSLHAKKETNSKAQMCVSKANVASTKKKTR